MDYNNIKKLLLVYLILLVFIGVFALIFGTKNLVIPIVVAITAVFTIRSDYSISPKLSFLKILFVFWCCAFVAFINTPENVLGLILGFILIFLITTSSFHVLTSYSYMPYVMCYLMMMSSSVTMEQMPVRLLALAVGALLIVLLNLLVHRSKHYDTKEELVNSLLDDLMLVIDAKLNNEEYESTIPKINDNVSSTVFENLGYRYLNNYRRESLTTICKTADGILNLINTGNLTDEELNRIKTEIIHVKNNEKIFRKQNESKVLSVILLNLEIIESQMDDMEVDVENTYDLSVVTSFIKNSLSFSSFGVSFAIKLASLISFWELLGMLFDLPYVK